MKRFRHRGLAAAALVVAVGLTGAACGTSSSGGGGNAPAGPADASAPLAHDAKVTISVDCMPPATKKAELKEWNEDVATFHKTYPNVTVQGKSTTGQCEDPATFAAQLKGGTEPNVFYSYFTDLQQVLNSGQAADITPYVTAKSLPTLGDIQPDVLNVLKDSGKLYGLPTSNYTMGILINRALFKQAGLDPDKPPATWAQVRTDAKAIAALGHGTAGYGDYSAGNNGGWHFTAEMYGLGGDVTTADGTKADFDNAKGRQILQNLHDMRWTDNSMGQTQLLKWGDLQKQMVSGKLGMFIAAPDDITYMVEVLGGHYQDYGMGPMPGGQGTLLGGNDYFFKKGDTPDQIKAGIAWLNFKFFTEGQGQFDYARTKADALPVGLPEPEFFTGASKATDDKLKAASATMPVANFTAFADHPLTGHAEPPNAQEIYKVLDNAMSGVLTNKNANVGSLLSTASSQVDQVLANSQ
ncbi:extracellular solute-binding protein [Streptantibioticus silvisoli]|uniref:Extracellular solute-binding protein n=1 Tax=Streptantibioticus silvisoli TaxID=2705255 RepID=A0ABT6W5I8_9ACTN|nr:extracellular solute-binding protein [Streptantibioticus silvisoli]MDI5965949.1 extracellular solute-binding protein [Streptantibioticus silvisoli]